MNEKGDYVDDLTEEEEKVWDKVWAIPVKELEDEDDEFWENLTEANFE